ncbi:Exocrine gland secreted peptide 5 [Apodemus speciosus]|uniref:Exocrine gland secreted peptide 5 n=1 Tax=Apodemus speciosus TaxID=105296 RepID=A0ABQ0FWC2_APOSI
MVLIQTQKESTISSNLMTHHKTLLDKTDQQGEGNKEDPEKIFSASNQDQTLFEDLAHAEKHKLNLSKNLMDQSKCCTQKDQADQADFNPRANRLQGTRVRYQGHNLKDEVICCLYKFLDSVKDVLVSH